MPKENYSESFINRLTSQRLMPPKTVHSKIVIAFASVLFAGCSAPEPQQIATPTSSTDQAPVLQVKQASYIFSMYPQYMNEVQSLLKLNIRDKDNAFVSGVRAFAELRAKDGHTAKVSFKEDKNIQRYVAEVALKHHEDYVIETHMQMPRASSPLFVAGFSFHCGDALPDDIHSDQLQPTEESHLK